MICLGFDLFFFLKKIDFFFKDDEKVKNEREEESTICKAFNLLKETNLKLCIGFL